ncbi:MAG: C4-type zinc ribbon domain-containing protein [Treponema sp.]|nr:C4-type zinc ribbon domain-containing protein [Treponema sp.]MCL2236630.1 C4-type zinc ribbon domain-containing protein [Treponema sp.]
MVTESDLDKLRSLQEIIYEKIGLEKGIREIPKLLGTQEEMLSRLKETFKKKYKDYENIKAEENDLKNRLFEAESSREKSEKNMDSIATQREYEALDKEIKDAFEKEQQYRKDLQHKERLLSELDEQIKQQASLIESQEKDMEDRRKKIEAEISDKQKQIDNLKKKESKLTENLDTEVVFKFERIIKNKMGIGIVAIKGNVCMGCHMILPVQFANEVRIREEFVFCPYCSRILFYEESAEGEEDYFNTEDTGALSDLDEMEDEEYEDDDEEEEIVNIDSEE